MDDKIRYHISPDKIYLIEVKGVIEEVTGRDLLQGYLTSRFFEYPLKIDSEAD